MLKQGTAPREFTDADELRAHYARLNARVWSAATPPLWGEVGASLLSTDGEVERRAAAEAQLAAEKAAALAAEVEEKCALIAEILDPVKVAREPNKIIRRIAEQHGLTFADLVGPGRTAPVIRVRWKAIAAVKAEYPTMSLPRLGQLFGRDHTTILHALRRIDGHTAREVRELRREGKLEPKTFGNYGRRPRPERAAP